MGFTYFNNWHTVSIVDGKYYVSDFANPRIIEVDPSSGTVNDSSFTSSQWDPSINGNLGGVIYDNSRGFYAYLGFKIWYLPISNGQPGTLQEVNITGLSGDQINVGTVYKLVFSNTTTATGSVVTTGLDDTSGVWYLSNNGSEYLFVCESQFGALFGLNSLESPFNIQVINL